MWTGIVELAIMISTMRYKVGIGPSKFASPSSSTGSRARSASELKYRKFKKFSSPGKKGSLFGKGPISGGRKAKVKKALSKAFGVFLGIVLVAAVGGTIFLGSTLASISSSLPDPDQLINRESAQSTRIYDRGGPQNGTLLFTIYGDFNREFVELDKIPVHTQWAVLAAEDLEFYDHKGLDIPGIISAAYRDLVKNETIGASTITQQLVRNTLLYDFLGQKAYERSIMRKIKEALITMQLEQTLEKDDILQMYLNEIALGSTSYGLQAASKYYFGKDVSELDLAESAMLAGLIQAPSYYSPLIGSNPEQAPGRQAYVLDQMYENREYIQRVTKRNGEELIITEEMITAAKEQVLAYSTVNLDIKAPHFVFYVKQQLEEVYGTERVEQGGLVVTTSLDYSTQQIAEEEIRAGIDTYREMYNVYNGAMVALDPRTGDILAMVGSYDYNNQPDPRVDGNVNITTSLRQVGSSAKLYTYATAIHQGYSPALLTPDLPFDFGYPVENSDGGFGGLINMRQAFVESRNIPAIYTMELIGGPDAFIKTAETLGITTLTDRDRYGLSLTLGAGEMKLLEHAGAYGVFAAEGIMHPTRPVLKVETYDGLDITDPKWTDTEGTRVWDDKEAYLVNWMLCDMENQGRIVPQYYTTPDQRLCGKTGTTTGPTDLNAVVYYPNLVVAVWTANNNNDVTVGWNGQGWSTTVPLPIANSFMTRVVPKYGTAWYGRPGGIVSGVVCKETGLLAKEDSPCTKVSSVFIEGHVPPVDNSFTKKPICKETGKIATNEQEAAAMGLIEYKNFIKITLPQTTHQAELDRWLAGSSVYGSMANLPAEDVCPLHLGPGNAPVITIKTPTNGQDFSTGDNMALTVLVNSLHGVTKVEYFMDGASIGSTTKAPYSYTYTIPASASFGSHTVLARVTDADSKTGEDTAVIQIVSPTPEITPTLVAPTDGGVVIFPQSMQVNISGDYGQVTSVKFYMNGPENYSTSGSKSNGGAVWKGTWAGPATSGSYTVFAIATVSGGATYQTESITVTVP